MMAESLGSYTYFETSIGLIAYSYGVKAQYDKRHMVCSTVGYFTPNPTSRVQVETGKYIEKFIWEGNEGSKSQDHKFRSLPPEIRQAMERYTQVHPITRESLLILPDTDVTKVYSPQWALTHNPRTEAVQRVASALTEIGIPLSDLGLYGSLQAGILNESPVTDVDILVYGIAHYRAIQQLTQNQPGKRAIPSKHSSLNEIEAWRLARQRRDSVAKLYLDDNLHADIRMVRKPQDPSSINFDNLELEDGEFTIKGLVTNSEQGLCIPSVVTVQSEDGDYHVGTRNYIYFGAAQVGDKVEAKGRKLKNEKTILIAKPHEDYIHTV
jgi:predicted nucleotidyltransferase